MLGASTSLFWDSCVFTAFLRNENDKYDVNSISQYLEDARDGKCNIFASSIVFAEVVRSPISSPSMGSLQDLMDDLQGAIIIVDANIVVMQRAGLLRNLRYVKGSSPGRSLATPDAIMLASCLYLLDEIGINIDSFHTFDNGKRHGPEGRSVPLLTYHEWCDGFTPEDMKVAKPIIDLCRCKPIHPSPKLPGT